MTVFTETGDTRFGRPRPSARERFAERAIGGAIVNRRARSNSDLSRTRCLRLEHALAYGEFVGVSAKNLHESTPATAVNR